MLDPLSTTDRARHSRQIILPQVGTAGQARLRSARVLVVGAGGLGSPALLYLAGAGVGTIGVVDDDVVDETNLHRQVVHRSESVGRAKTASAAAALTALDPDVTVREHRVRLTTESAAGVLDGYDLVLDGADNFPTRYAVSAACLAAGVPHVWGSVLGFQGQASVWGLEQGPCYRCVFPDPPPPGSVPSCAEGGVLGPVCAAIGATQAMEAIKLLIGLGTALSGTLLVHDALAQTWQRVPVARDPDCPGCGPRPRPPLDASSACGVDGPTAGLPAAQTISPQQAWDLLHHRDAHPTPRPRAVLLDVRTGAERETVHIQGSTHLPMDQLLGPHGTDAVPDADTLVVHCAAGSRSARCAATLAERYPERTVLDLAGGIDAWRRAGLPIA